VGKKGSNIKDMCFSLALELRMVDGYCCRKSATNTGCSAVYVSVVVAMALGHASICGDVAERGILGGA
jgi:hypothetical protein